MVSLTLIPSALRGTNWEATWRVVAGAIILVTPALMIGRQVQRASHPWTVRRIWRLHQLRLFSDAGTASKAPRPLDVA